MMYYALRHIPTGFYMPERHKGWPGYTSLDFMDPTYHNIRLFVERKGAATALTWYLAGPVHVEHYGRYDDVEQVTSMGDEPKPSEEYEIVKLKMEVMPV